MSQAEANIQAEFYHLCRLSNVPVELEMTTPVGRLDIALLSSDFTHILAIVECKRLAMFSKASQLRRYRALGVTVYELFSKADAAPLLARILHDIEGLKGVRITDLGVRLEAVVEERRNYQAEKRARKIDRWNENLIVRG